MTVQAGDQHHRERVDVGGTEMSYVDVGEGQPVVFLHGNPTSSYLWRNVIPHLAGQWRCLAPDLVGMGRSGPAPDGQYRFADHAGYLDAWFDAVVPDGPVVLVVHDWGGALGLWWAYRHPERVAGIAYMETLVLVKTWADFGDHGRPFRRLRSPEGERLVYEENFFVETILPGNMFRRLDEQEMETYRAPFREPASRTPTLTFPRQIPIEGEPRAVAEIVEQYGAWLSASPIPKLLIKAEPGALLTGRAYEFARTWPNQREVTVQGRHYIQEDVPDEIGAALREFAASIDPGESSRCFETLQ
jgi:haloalkane dehalogenase